MEKIIFLNAGHSELEPGATSLYGVERDLNIAVRDELIPQLKDQGFEVEVVPDNLNFRDSYKWVNERTFGINDGLALDVHQNKGGQTGAEAYYYTGSSASKKIAKDLVDAYSTALGIKNRGPKPDSQSQHGEISWIRETKVWAALIECGYMDSTEDMEKIIGHFDLVAKAIAKGVCAVYNINYIEKSPRGNPLEGREEIIKKAKEIIKLAEKL
jgi:N-acetylmuramoyl-L-alanine amidase|tara:strand:- start:20 stop:658 length:639 start_codon:yes stop_codon:yes gene_type:complete